MVALAIFSSTSSKLRVLSSSALKKVPELPSKHTNHQKKFNSERIFHPQPVDMLHFAESGTNLVQCESNRRNLKNVTATTHLVRISFVVSSVSPFLKAKPDGARRVLASLIIASHCFLLAKFGYKSARGFQLNTCVNQTHDHGCHLQAYAHLLTSF